MLDFAKDKKFWERVRTSGEFEQHRRELYELYEKAFAVPPPSVPRCIGRRPMRHLRRAQRRFAAVRRMDQYERKRLCLTWLQGQNFGFAA